MSNTEVRRPRPIFIIGAPRSATSAMVWALGQHPNIQPMPETAWIASMAVSAFLSHRKGSERGRFSHLSNVDYALEPFMARIGESIDAIVDDVFAVRCERFYGDFRSAGVIRINPQNPNAHLQLMRSPGDPKTRWIDGTPLNTQYVLSISQLFPDARYLHNLRRPDDVAASLEGFANVGADPQPIEAGIETWIQHSENAWLAERAFGAQSVFRVDFDRIASEPEALLHDICEFLDEPYAPDCLEPLTTKLNSSEVDTRREEVRERLRDVPAFARAEALYDQIRAAPVPRDPDPAALAILEQRLIDYCHERSVV